MPVYPGALALQHCPPPLDRLVSIYHSPAETVNHHLRWSFRSFVRRLHRYYAAVRLLQRVHVRRSVICLPGPACRLHRRNWRSPGSRACCFTACMGSSTTPDLARTRDLTFALHQCCLPQRQDAVGIRFSIFRGSIAQPAAASVYASSARLATDCARLEVRIESLLLSCRALSSPTTCRFIPAHSEWPTNRLESSHPRAITTKAIIAPTHGSNCWYKTRPLRNSISFRGWRDG